MFDRELSRSNKVLLGGSPFLVVIAIYGVASYFRRLENPADKLLPSFEAIGAAAWRMAFVADRRSGDYLLWVDTIDSLARLGAGLGISTAMALLLGLAIGSLSGARATLAPFIASVSLIPPITILPILFIVFGLGEASKVMLIVIGTAPVMIRSVAQAVLDVPSELLVKARTLGASRLQTASRAVIPLVFPKLITALRLGLVPGWIFLISAEAIASTSGLGYRIFLVRRYLAMDTILAYVIWITILAIVIDRLLLLASRRGFRWHHLGGKSL